MPSVVLRLEPTRACSRHRRRGSLVESEKLALEAGRLKDLPVVLILSVTIAIIYVVEFARELNRFPIFSRLESSGEKNGILEKIYKECVFSVNQTSLVT